MLIRSAEPGDVSAVLALVQAMGGHDEILAQPDAWESFAAAVTRPEIRVLVADDGGTVVGYAELHARPSVVRGCREGWLAGLVVAADRRSQSLGAFVRPVASCQESLLEDRFLAAAARAATMVAAAVTGLADEAPVAMGADGAPTEAADRGAENVTSGRRWWAAAGGGAWVDGRPARSRSGPIALRPSPALAVADGRAR